MQNQSAVNKQLTALEIATEISSVKARLDYVKPFYEYLDKLTAMFVEVAGAGEVLVPEHAAIINGQPTLVPAQYVKVVDNFENKNVVFKAAGVRRFEATTESVVEREIKQVKEIEKLQKKAAVAP